MGIKDIIFANKESFYDNFPDAIIVLDFMRNITYWNKRAEILFGYSKLEIKNKNISLIFNEDLNKFNQIIGLTHGTIIHALNKSGESFFVDVTAFDAANTAKTIVSVRALSNKFLELQNLLDDYQTTKMLVAQRDSFLSSLKFDIITPLNAAIGFSQSLITGVCGKLNTKQLKYANIINLNNNKVKILMDKIFEIIDLDADKKEFNFKNFDFIKMIEFVVENKSQIAQEKGLMINTEITVEKRIAYSDEYAFAQVLDILLDNAIKFSANSEIKIKAKNPEIEVLECQEIKIPAGYSEKSYLQVDIIDNGIGISDEKIPEIFNEYSAKNLSSSQKYEGSALSLPIAKKIIHKLNGSIHYASNEKSGSIFTIIIPIERMSFEE